MYGQEAIGLPRYEDMHQYKITTTMRGILLSDFC